MHAHPTLQSKIRRPQPSPGPSITSIDVLNPSRFPATVRMNLQSETWGANGLNTFCLKTNVIGCDPSSPCCSMDLYKIELFMNNKCWGAVRNVTVNG